MFVRPLVKKMADTDPICIENIVNALQDKEDGLDVLQIRASIGESLGIDRNSIDKRDLNAFLYKLEKDGVLNRYQPKVNRKPFWTLNESIVTID